MHRSLTVAIALTLACAPLCVAVANPQKGTQVSEVTTQLPRDVRPTHYEISVTPHAGKLTFDGRVEVTIDVLQAT
ncbi:MAG TPA: hypothetical protein PLJ77_12480, partial [Dokdonella sp.]|nr:hypothetical protein [Dokdonella sp.]